jgi:hypothetical protein
MKAITAGNLNLFADLAGPVRVSPVYITQEIIVSRTIGNEGSLLRVTAVPREGFFRSLDWRDPQRHAGLICTDSSYATER